MKRKRNIIIAAFIVVLILAYIVWGNPNITVVGYYALTFKAGSTEQRVNFRNPNSACYMKMTLLQDGGELWTSELIEPGGSVNTISLAHSLSAGTYRVVMKHEFFSLNDKSTLNGLNISLRLKVE